ncbi:uncharacterized protein LOC119328772 isoform X5 [Triticum dicoccoides]|uniref:uncharacterized protein LOC119328772 isoform X5 n=1 Tax=Triticum dicoccoides TaxID=85692 RepID=UPI001890C640|nr:uncharacterized protein LOC119328772 isoform X5 [Triticum dicoccoides]
MCSSSPPDGPLPSPPRRSSSTTAHPAATSPGRAQRRFGCPAPTRARPRCSTKRRLHPRHVPLPEVRKVDMLDRVTILRCYDLICVLLLLVVCSLQGWSLLFFRVQQLMVICPKQKLVSNVAYLIEQKCQKQITLMFMCYVLCFAAADLFLWRNKKIFVGVLTGATAIWLLFEFFSCIYLLVVTMLSMRSYTREDVVELQCRATHLIHLKR